MLALLGFASSTAPRSLPGGKRIQVRPCYGRSARARRLRIPFASAAPPSCCLLRWNDDSIPPSAVLSSASSIIKMFGGHSGGSDIGLASTVTGKRERQNTVLFSACKQPTSKPPKKQKKEKNKTSMLHSRQAQMGEELTEDVGRELALSAAGRQGFWMLWKERTGSEAPHSWVKATCRAECQPVQKRNAASSWRGWFRLSFVDFRCDDAFDCELLARQGRLRYLAPDDAGTKMQTVSFSKHISYADAPHVDRSTCTRRERFPPAW